MLLYVSIYDKKLLKFSGNQAENYST